MQSFCPTVRISGRQVQQQEAFHHCQQFTWARTERKLSLVCVEANPSSFSRKETKKATLLSYTNRGPRKDKLNSYLFPAEGYCQENRLFPSLGVSPSQLWLHPQGFKDTATATMGGMQGDSSFSGTNKAFPGRCQQHTFPLHCPVRAHAEC